MNGLRVALLGFVLPEENFEQLLATDMGMPVQTQRFGRSLVKALQDGGARVSLLSAAPATNYPHNSTIRFRTRAISEGGVAGLELGFLNLPVLKHASRAAAVLRYGPRQLAAAGTDVLLIHGVHSPWLAFGVYASRHLGIPAVVVMTDPPNVPHHFDTVITKALKKVDERVVTGLVKRFDGIVALTRPLAEDFAPGVPYMVMEGIAPSMPPVPPDSKTRSSIPVVVYAGGLSESYGVDLLMDAHALDPNAYELKIAGRGPLEAAVRSRAAVQRNLRFLGLVAPSELPRLYASADVLVNPRPPSQLTRYSFPSKILEYLAAGRPVVSTRLEGIPEEYGRVLTWARSTPSALQQALAPFASASAADRAEAGRRSRAFVSEYASSHSQGIRLVSFLTNLALGGT